MNKKILLLSCFISMHAIAVEIEPGDFTPAPKGTNLFLLYWNHINSNSLKLNGVELKDQTDQKLDIGLLRLVRFSEIAGMPFNYQLIVPFGKIDGQLAGNDLKTKDTQMGDPMLGFVLWPYNNPEKKSSLGIASITALPWGHYSQDSNYISLGTNTWTQDFQFVYTKGWNSGYKLETSFDIYLYGKNDEYGPLNQNLKVENSYKTQVWFSKDISPLTNIGLGYSYTTGGDQEIDGLKNGLNQDIQKVRLSGSHFFTKTDQLQAEINHGFQNKGGYDQEFGFQLRYLKIF
ncbi:transporter [Acinetobacter baumannii]